MATSATPLSDSPPSSAHRGHLGAHARPGPAAATRRNRPTWRGTWVFRLAVLVATLAPIANALGAYARGWVPYGDEAIIVTRAYDVGTRLTPLIGMPSSFNEAGAINPNALGPLQFWALAPFVRLLGPSLGSLLGTAAVNSVSILLVAVVLRRRLGRGVALLAIAACLVGTIGVSGPGSAFRLINSIAPLLPLIATVVLSWAVSDGAWEWLPALAVFASYTAQGDAEFTGMVVIVVVWAVAACAVGHRGKDDAQRPARGPVETASERPAGRRRAVLACFRQRRRPLVGAATAIACIACWSGPLADAGLYGGGNLRRFVDLLMSGLPTFGRAGANHALGAVLNIPPFLVTYHSESGWSHGLNLTAVVPAGAWVALYLWARRADRAAERRLLVAAAVAVAAAAISGYHLPLNGSWDVNHTVFAQGTSAVLWFCLAGITYLALRRSFLTVIPLMALVGVSYVAVTLLFRLSPLTFALTAALKAAMFVAVGAFIVVEAVRSVTRRSSRRKPGPRWLTDVHQFVTSAGRCGWQSAAAIVVVLAVVVAQPPSLPTTYLAWSHTATPAITTQIFEHLRPPPQPPNAYLVVFGGNERHRLLFEGVVLEMRARHVPLVFEPTFNDTYGARRSYPNNRPNTLAELALLPAYATQTPPGAQLLAHWQPADWNAAAKADLDRQIAAFVRRQGRITLDDSGALYNVLRYATPDREPSGLPHVDRFRTDPMMLTQYPEALTALYQEGWIASPSLPPDVQHKMDALLANGLPVNIWLLPRPAPADGS